MCTFDVINRFKIYHLSCIKKDNSYNGLRLVVDAHEVDHAAQFTVIPTISVSSRFTLTGHTLKGRMAWFSKMYTAQINH